MDEKPSEKTGNRFIPAPFNSAYLYTGYFKLYHGYSDHYRFLVLIAPDGMRNRTFYKKGLVPADNDLFIAEKVLRLALYHYKQMIMFMGMLSRRPPPFRVIYAMDPSMIRPAFSKSFFASKFTWSGGVMNPSFIFHQFLSKAVLHHKLKNQLNSRT